MAVKQSLHKIDIGFFIGKLCFVLTGGANSRSVIELNLYSTAYWIGYNLQNSCWLWRRDGNTAECHYIYIMFIMKSQQKSVHNWKTESNCCIMLCVSWVFKHTTGWLHECYITTTYVLAELYSAVRFFCVMTDNQIFSLFLKVLAMITSKQASVVWYVRCLYLSQVEACV